MGQDNRRQFLIASGALLAARLAHAQQTEKARRIGWLASDSRTDVSAQFWRKELPASLLRLGFEEGKNLVIDTRYAENKLERLPALAEELVPRV